MAKIETLINYSEIIHQILLNFSNVKTATDVKKRWND